MEFTYLFYGFYNDTVVDDSTFSYSLPLAYIFTIAFYFVFCFIGIVARSVPDFYCLFVFSMHLTKMQNKGTSLLPPPVSHSMGATARVVVASGGGAVGSYSMTVFTGWDYGSTNQTATTLKQKNIHYQLQVRGQQGIPAWCKPVWRLSDGWPTLFLSGGAGRAAVKGKGSCSDSASESHPVLPPGFFFPSVSGAHCSGPVLHRPGIELQPGG